MTMLKLAIITSLLAFGAPAFAQDSAHIQMLNDQFAAAFNKGDAAAIGAMYTEEAVVLPAGSPLVRGREAIQNFWKKGSEQLEGMRLTTIDVQPLGNDAAREIGTFVLKTKGQSPQQVDGKYVVIWQKEGGNWKLSTDIWNSNK
ncbi:MAG: nuclear transport factor 2 family protein [Hyphomicrobiales bacterium]|nr:nuclear transport factor 2 family protein [Hyphomicrobiales bacterium]MBV9976999.1 nuclear transport factor 2 family protein [Hyphomicrobiales bacterium]